MTNQSEAEVIDSPDTSAAFDILDSDEAKMQRFLLWVEEQGAVFPATTIKVGQGTRESQAVAPVIAGGLIMHIPQSLMITTEVAKASWIGKLVAAKGLTVSNYGYIAAYLLDARRDGGFWKPYIDVLPAEIPDHPLFFSDAEFEYLKGTQTMNQVKNAKEWVDYDYRQLMSVLPENKKFSKEDFAWARCIVMTRVHGVTFYQNSSVAMIPLADMPNHSRNWNVRWRCDSSLGFVYMAERKLEAGETLTITYGDKSNSSMFAVYGFCLDDNPTNDTEIEVPALTASHPFHEYSKNLGTARGDMRVFMVPAKCDAPEARALMTYLRLSFLDDLPGVDRSKAPEGPQLHVAPVSEENELKALAALASACERRLQQFGTSIEEDEALLAEGALPRKLQYAVRVRRDEKTVLKYFLDLARTATSVMQDAGTRKFARYFTEAYQLLSKQA